MLNRKEKTITFTQILIDQYNLVLQQGYQIAYETTPQAFRLSDKNNIKIIHAVFDEKLFRDDSEKIFLFFVKDANLEYEFIDYSDPINNKDYMNFNSDDSFMISKITEKSGLNFNDLVFSVISAPLFLKYDGVDSTEYKENIMKVFDETLFNQMKNLVRMEGSNYQKHSNLTSGYYAKNAARYAYSLLDLSPIIDKVNDEDFEYQLDQSIAAYDNSLYLASCATLGVCLETVCKLILINNGKKIKDSDPTMLDKLSERLKSEGLINYKDKSRIDVCYKVRNLSSHTSPGKVTQNDCHFLINTIQSLVEEYF